MILIKPRNTFVLSVGGSVFAPNGKDQKIDIPYLNHFEKFIRAQIAKNRRFFIVCGGGWKPGWSTDYCSALIANDYHLNLVINLSNIDQVYDKDPNKFPDAKPIAKMNWQELTGLVGKDWQPGLNAPFDPIASKLAKEIKLKVIICNGHDLDNVGKILDNQEYTGT